MTFLCTLATKWAKISSIYSKITKLHPMCRDFSAKPYPIFRDFFCEKVTHLSGTHPYTLLGEYPPPPPGGATLAPKATHKLPTNTNIEKMYVCERGERASLENFSIFTSRTSCFFQYFCWYMYFRYFIGIFYLIILIMIASSFVVILQIINTNKIHSSTYIQS